MTRTYTEADRATLTLPALPGILAGWWGVVEELNPGDDRGWIECGWEGGRSTDPRDFGCDGVRLPLSRWEARARVVAWLAEGKRCPHSGKVLWSHPGSREPSWDFEPESNPVPCRDCRGTGYLRAPVDLRWALDFAGLPGCLPAWQSAAVIHASALRVAAGMGAIRDVWTRDSEGYTASNGTGPMVRTSRGEADEIAWALGRAFALLDGDTLRAEVPNE